MTDSEMKAIVLKDARSDAAIALRKRAVMLTDLAKNLEISASSIESGENRMTFPVRGGERMSWAINDIENVMRNFNFSELARHVAALEVASNMNERN